MGYSNIAEAPNMPSAAGAVLLAGGWLSFAVIANEVMIPSDFSLVLVALTIAEVIGRLLVTGWVSIDRETHLFSWSHSLASIMLRWVAFVAMLGVLFAVAPMPLLIGQPISMLYIAGASLALSVSNLAAAQRSALHQNRYNIFPLRMVFAAALLWGLDEISEIDAGLLLSALLLLWLAVAVTLLQGLPSPFSEVGSPRQPQLRKTVLAFGPALLKVADILILPCVLSPVPAAGYIGMRAGGLLTIFTLSSVQAATRERLKRNSAPSLAAEFAADAARLNLGLLLIGGGVSVGILVIQPYITPHFSPFASGDVTVLLWILLGALAPALLGAAPVLLSLTGHRREWALISFVGVLLLAALTYSLRISTPLGLAQVYAAVQLATIACAALIIGRTRGVWPGLTAVLFRRIRLT
ncbi:hypothetical protein [Sulfitobacter delicatus]|nr:hypothetical protein [Sulfitobacter delicatus]